jgi:hypothetical protein
MSIISLKFDGINELINIEIENTANGELFHDYLKGFDRPADSMSIHQSFDQCYEDFLDRARLAQDLFKFEWDLTVLSQENFNNWHRDIEAFDITKHPPVTDEKGDFFINLHSALHRIEAYMAENPDTITSQRKSCAIKWFANSIPWPEIPKFKPRLAIKKGDIIVEFPHVGKSPWVSLQHNDTTNLVQSCRLPDMCPPGFIIQLTEKGWPYHHQVKKIKEEKQQLIDWYEKNSSVLSKIFTKEQMLSYDGEYCIGKLQDLNQIDLLQSANFTSVSIV